MTHRFEIKKNLLGKYIVGYACPKCGERLRSPIGDAGNTDTCPNCHTGFIVPGSDERERIFKEQETVRLQKEQRRLEKEAAAEQQRREQFAMMAQQEQENAALAEARQAILEQGQREQQKERERQQPATRRCPFCAEEILLSAVKCKHCSEFLDGRNPPTPVVGQAKQPRATNVSGLSACLALLLVAVCCGIPMCGDYNSQGRGGGSSSPSSPTPRASSGPTKIEAWVMAQNFVEDRLKSPSSASYGGIMNDYQDPDEVVSDLGGGKFRVAAWVDAQNAFGATIRTHFICDLAHTGADNWRCTNLELLE